MRINVYAGAIAGVLMTATSAGDDLPDCVSQQLPDFMQAIGARRIDEVASMTAACPSLAGTSWKDIPVVLWAAFAKEKNGPFHRPEDNQLLRAVLAAEPELGIWEAAVTGDLPLVERFIQDDAALVGRPAPSGWTPLHFAAFSGNAALVSRLLEKGAEVNAVAERSSRTTPLNSALFTRRYECARTLLAHGADPNHRQTGGFTPLHEAALLGSVELARLLLDHGAAPEASTEDRRTALSIARDRNHQDLIELLEAR